MKGKKITSNEKKKKANNIKEKKNYQQTLGTFWGSDVVLVLVLNCLSTG